MKELVLMVGLPRSGKTSMVERDYKDYSVISRDSIRELIHNDKSNMSNENAVTMVFNSELDILMKSGVNIVIDNTNLKFEYRKRFYDKARMNGYRVKLIILLVPLHTIKERCEECNFPFNVVIRMATGYDIVDFNSDDSEYLKKQGIEYSINYSYEEGCDGSILLEQAKGFNQHNSHHDLSLYDHLIKANLYSSNSLSFEDENYDATVTAALFHDIGKLYTQEFDEDGEAHYYGHPRVGCYMYYASNLFLEPQEMNKILFLIMTHMVKYQDIGAKGARKFVKHMQKHNVTLDMVKVLCYADIYSKGGLPSDEDRLKVVKFIDRLKAAINYLCRETTLGRLK